MSDLPPEPPNEPTPPAGGGGDDGVERTGIQMIEIQSEMETSFLDYAMSVIISRALPDVRDGLKPVHRRILWGMSEGGYRPDRSRVKCAKVTGDVMGNYHPHGDSAIYDALARMAQPFSLRHPLIDFKGNYGSPEFPPAAQRYTECRLGNLAMRMLADIDEDTVDFIPTYDGSKLEPTVLPARFPNLLVNGSQGIAVGMATSIPPHNLGEVIDAVVHLLANPEATADDLMQFVKGPDFPTRGTILGRAGIVSAYRTGRGSVRVRAKAEITEMPGRSNRMAIVVSELPYQVSPGMVAGRVLELIRAREIDGIADINDESAGEATRLVFELKRDANPNVVLNNLYKQTALQSSFPFNMVALVDGVPRTLNLRDMLVAYVEHQREVVRRRSEFRLAKALDRAHIIEGLLRAIDMIDAIIAAIRASDDRDDARTRLMATPFEFSERQANYILDMQLVRLTRLGRTNLEQELTELRSQIAELESILGDDAKLREVIRAEIIQVRDGFATPRQTELAIDLGEFDIEDLIDDEDLVFTLSAGGYVKTVKADEFRAQARGGRGITGAGLKDEDYVNTLIHTTAHAYLLFFSNRGRVYRLKAHEIPVAGRTARGTALVNLLPLQADERIQAVIDTRDYETNRYLFFATKKGRVKKTRFNEYDSSLRAGLIAIRLNEGDELVSVIPTNGGDEMLLCSASGQTIRFSEDLVRDMGRAAAGVTGMRFRAGDELVSCDVARPGATLLHITSAGFGKRTPVDRYPTKGRGGLGVRGIRITEARGRVAAAFMVDDDNHVLLVASGGIVIRVRAADISLQGRDASGVRVMNLEAGQYVAAAARVLASDDDAEETTPVAEVAEGGPGDGVLEGDVTDEVEADDGDAEADTDELDELEAEADDVEAEPDTD
jgi:DNA gyrase subunit A